MSGRRLLGLVEGFFWQATAPLRGRLRRLRTALAMARYRSFRPAGAPPFRTVATEPGIPPAPLRGVALSVHFAPHSDRAGWLTQLEGSTETAWSLEQPEAAPWSLTLAGAAAPLRRAELETLLLAGEGERLDWVGTADRRLLLLRQPGQEPATTPRLGRALEFPPGTEVAAPTAPWTVAGDRYLLAAPPADGVLPTPAVPLAGRLPSHPKEERRGALLILPFLAVGGAERLLLDYLAAFGERRRLLVATTEPHRRELGDRLAETEALAPVFPLGDLFARPLQLDLVATLIERHAVDTLVSWNGTTFFYDALPELRRRFPTLRIVQQLFDHRTGWIRRLTPEQVTAIDCHLAVNRPIADELERGRGVPAERIAVVRHGIAPPPPEDAEGRHAERAELGVPDGVPLVASFLRLHPQKRPLDILALARRFRPEEARFLVIGGGPLDAAVDAELARAPIPHLARRPLASDAARWFDAVDLCLLTSEHEGLPLFLLEGMARGRPAVATAVGEIPELLSPGGGAAAPVGDLDALERALRGLLEAGARRRAGEIAARTVAERHTLARCVAETDAALFGGTGT